MNRLLQPPIAAKTLGVLHGYLAIRCTEPELGDVDPAIPMTGAKRPTSARGRYHCRQQDVLSAKVTTSLTQGASTTEYNAAAEVSRSLSPGRSA